MQENERWSKFGKNQNSFIMKHFQVLVAALMITCAASGQAENTAGVLRAPNSKVVAWTNPQTKDTKFVVSKDRKQLRGVSNKIQKKTEGSYSVTFNMVGGDFTPSRVEIYPSADFSHDSNYFVWADETGNYVQEVPAGMYDCVGHFANYDTGYDAVVVKGKVTISCDTTIEINTAGVKKVEIKSYNPNGELFKPDKWDYDEDWNYVLKEKGNINGVFGYYNLFRKSDLASMFSGMSYGLPKLYINDLGDDYFYAENRSYYNEGDNGELYLLKYYLCGNDQLLENRASDYVYHQEEFASSLAGKESEKSIGAYFETHFDGNYMTSGGIDLGTGNVIKLWVNAPKSEHINMLYLPTMDDQLELQIFSFTDMEGNIVFSDTVPRWNKIYGAPVSLDGTVKHIEVNGPAATGLPFMKTPEAGKEFFPVFPGNKTYSFAPEQKGGLTGDNVPVNLLYIQDYMGNVPELHLNYMGRYGESREVDTKVLTIEFKANGTPVECDNMESLTNYFWSNPDRQIGILDFTFDNKNIEVDGLQGRNLTTLHIDETKDDHHAPTLTMLQFRNTSDVVTDRFETENDGQLIFSCGDFNYSMDTWYFECNRPEIEVYAAPYQETDSWSAVRVTEDVEAFTVPAFGHCFKAPLTQIENQGGNGWYDLKFVLKDTAGNTQEQIISPAFKIESYTTGLGEINTGNAIEVARYSIDGKTLSAPQTGVNIVRYSDGTARKIYVK